MEISPIGSWERWFVIKEIELFNVKQKAVIEKQREINANIKKNEEIRRRREQGQRAHEKWLADKNNYVKQQRIAEKLKREKINLEKEKEKKIQEERSNEVFKEWIKKKQIERSENHKFLRENKLKLEQKFLGKNQRSQMAYEKWIESAKFRKIEEQRSYAYKDGKLVGYYDRARNPRPSFYNSEPWYPPDDA